MTGAERGRILKRAADLLRARNDGTRAARDPRHRQADPGDHRGRRALRRRLPRVFRRPRGRPRRRARRPRPVGLRLHPPRAARRRRRHRRLELPAPDRLLEGGAGARLRQRDDLQAGGADAAHGASSSPRSSPRPACPTGVFNVVQGFAETGRLLTRHPGDRQGLAHRRGRHRQGGDGRRGARR